MPLPRVTHAPFDGATAGAAHAGVPGIGSGMHTEQLVMMQVPSACVSPIIASASASSLQQWSWRHVPHAPGNFDASQVSVPELDEATDEDPLDDALTLDEALAVVPAAPLPPVSPHAKGSAALTTMAAPMRTRRWDTGTSGLGHVSACDAAGRR